MSLNLKHASCPGAPQNARQSTGGTLRVKRIKANQEAVTKEDSQHSIKLCSLHWQLVGYLQSGGNISYVFLIVFRTVSKCLGRAEGCETTRFKIFLSFELSFL